MAAWAVVTKGAKNSATATHCILCIISALALTALSLPPIPISGTIRNDNIRYQTYTFHKLTTTTFAFTSRGARFRSGSGSTSTSLMGVPPKGHTPKCTHSQVGKQN